MTFRQLTAGVFLVLLAAGVGLDQLARRRGGLPTLRWIGRRFMSSRSGRFGMWFTWAWLGWHFFVR